MKYITTAKQVIHCISHTTAAGFGEKERLCFPQFGEAKSGIFRSRRMFDES